MSYKIKSLKAEKGFGGFSNLTIEFDEKTTYLVGVNGSGKTLILLMIWATMKGIAEKDTTGQVIAERFRFLPRGQKSVDLELTVIDEDNEIEILIKNHITTGSNAISFTGPENYPIDDNWLKNLLSITLMSATKFASLTPQDQALELGINTTDFDLELSKKKQDYSVINVRYKSYGELIPPEKAEKVSIAELMQKREQVEAHNELQEERTKDIDTVNGQKKTIEDIVSRYKVEVEELEQRLKATKNAIETRMKEIEDLNTKLDDLPKPESMESTETLDEQILAAEEINEKAIAYKKYLEDKEAKEKERRLLEHNKKEQQEIIQRRQEFIKSFDFGFEGLGVDDTGRLLLNDRPIRKPYFSSGELELIVARIWAAQHPEFKVRWIDDFDLLDEDNQQKITKELLSLGFQLILSQVGKKKKKGENCILLKECTVVNDYKEPKQEKLI